MSTLPNTTELARTSTTKENASMLLIYHANCKKTAFIALNLLVCYTELGDLTYKLSRLSHKELCYFEQLASIIKKR